jgi:hypothetical protein
MKGGGLVKGEYDGEESYGEDHSFGRRKHFEEGDIFLWEIFLWRSLV